MLPSASSCYENPKWVNSSFWPSELTAVFQWVSPNQNQSHHSGQLQMQHPVIQSKLKADAYVVDPKRVRTGVSKSQLVLVLLLILWEKREFFKPVTKCSSTKKRRINHFRQQMRWYRSGWRFKCSSHIWLVLSCHTRRYTNNFSVHTFLIHIL